MSTDAAKRHVRDVKQRLKTLFEVPKNSEEHENLKTLEIHEEHKETEERKDRKSPECHVDKSTWDDVRGKVVPLLGVNITRK